MNHIDPEIGFTSDVITDPKRFVGRTDLIRDCMKAINAPLGLIAVYGKRGVGKSSLLRQIQQMALGNYALARQAGLEGFIPKRPRKYLTVYYACDSNIRDAENLLQRLCNDQNTDDGLLRLVPNDGAEVVEFSRSDEDSVGIDLKLLSWGAKGIDTSKYAKVVENDTFQTFRNFVNSVITHQVKGRMKRDGLLILVDEFDVIKDKTGLGSLIKSLSSADVKFAICGIGQDLADLVQDHASVERLLEEGAVHVKPMSRPESEQIIYTAQNLFNGSLTFEVDVIHRIAEISQGYPYFTQLIGKECANEANRVQVDRITLQLFEKVLEDIRSGAAFPTLESAYQRAIGSSEDRQFLLHLLAEQEDDTLKYNEEVGRVLLKHARQSATELDIQYVDQLLPRLVDEKYGPVLSRVPEGQGVYEFVNPVLREYVRLRKM